LRSGNFFSRRSEIFCDFRLMAARRNPLPATLCYVVQRGVGLVVPDFPFGLRIPVLALRKKVKAGLNYEI
jgi:hypothetical protein